MSEAGDLRGRLATALHDGPVQALSAAELLLSGAATAIAEGDRARAESLVDEARAAVRETAATLRDEAALLRAAEIGEGLRPALERCRPVWSRRYGCEITLDVPDEPLSPAAADALFAVAAESVANAGRHAHAEAVAVTFARADGAWELTVADDGDGIDPRATAAVSDQDAAGTGIPAMRERVERLGGRLEISSAPDGGTRVRAHLPLG